MKTKILISHLYKILEERRNDSPVPQTLHEFQVSGMHHIKTDMFSDLIGHAKILKMNYLIGTSKEFEILEDLSIEQSYPC